MLGSRVECDWVSSETNFSGKSITHASLLSSHLGHSKCEIPLCFEIKSLVFSRFPAQLSEAQVARLWTSVA